jgi:actin-related protein 3
VEYRIALYNNVVLSVGSTLFKDFDRRLQRNLQKRIDATLEPFNRGAKDKTKIDCQVSQNIVHRYAVWFGGSVLGARPDFAKIAHSREDYLEKGP